MADQLTIDLGLDGRVSVIPHLEGERPRAVAAEPFELAWPLDDEALEDLRWYLEEYLQMPYGVYEDRGARVAAALRGWGEALFGALFGAGSARDAYLKLRGSQAGVELVFRSGSPRLLGLPWELLADPDRETPVALDLVGVSRSVPTAALAESFAVSGDRLRVLMVISRPEGGRDVGYRMVARPLLERLEAVRGEVDLVVLRPPTLEALRVALAEARAQGCPFQVVHFDGHGAMAKSRAAAGAGVPLTFDATGEGVLVFERPEGGSDPVPASRVAQVLKEGEVPLVVLNACQSGAVGKELEAAVATRLLREGIGSVVAMAYVVYAVAAAEFMAAFYEDLFTGRTVSEAVSAGRRRLWTKNERLSPKGEMPLDDWIVPVHYAHRDVQFPGLRTARPADAPSLAEALDSLRERPSDGDDGELASEGAFVGRDTLFYELEVAGRERRAIVLHGPGGSGKTELAKAFGRWWRDTGGVEQPGWVILHSFEPGVASFGLDGVIAQVGLRVFGTEFARLDPDERRAVVMDLLTSRRLLLIWDNFESVFTMPDPERTTPPLEQAEREELHTFVQAIAAGGQSTLIITSRTSEDWLGNLHRTAVGGLAGQEVTDYADQLLQPFAAATRPRRAKRTFAELLQWLDGHPLSMRLILPHLVTTEPEALLSGLQGIGDLPAAPGGGEGRTRSLTASVMYSFKHLEPAARRMLVAVSLFQGIVDVSVLGFFSKVDGVPARFGNITTDAWREALDRATAVGLLTWQGGGMYGIHPALPSVLAALWRDEAPEEYDGQRHAALQALLIAYAALGIWLDEQIHSGQAAVAFGVIDLQQRTLGHLLGFALDDGRWEAAQAVVRPLDDYFDARGLHSEARAWVDRARLALESPGEAPPSLETSAGELWLFLVIAQANRELRSHHLDSAEQTYRGILEALEAHPPFSKQESCLKVIYHQLGGVAELRGRLDEAEDWYQRSLEIEERLGNQLGMASSYHQLGGVAELRDRLDEAEDWYQRSLEIEERLGNQPGMASTYHQLGITAQKRGRLNEAEDWYQRSLEIKERLGDQPGAARTYHQLGTLAQRRGRFDEAEDWYQRSLEINEHLGNQPGMASTYHQLGTVAHKRGQFDEAEHWYQRSLEINEHLGNQPGMASTYGQLGTVAHKRGQFDEAEHWYRRSLEIAERLGNRPGMASTYGQLGLLAEARGRDEDALAWTVRSAMLFEEFPHPATGPGPQHLARLTAKLGIDALVRCWQDVTGRQLPDVVREFVSSPPFAPGAQGAG